MEKKQLKQILAVARGDTPADQLIENIKILDLVNGDLIHSKLAIVGEYIAAIGLEYSEAKEVIDGKGAVVVPGFIDSHMHLESTLMSPFEFERVTLPLGTTSVVCDPHEMTNVLGVKALKWYLECATQTYQNQLVQLSSCVPALEGFETNGAKISAKDLKKLKKHPSVLGLAEMMNFPGVINGDDDVLDKIQVMSDKNLDGHCPMVRGKELNAYIAAGIQNCHETVELEEAREKLQKGMGLIIREGSVARNLDDLAPIVSEFNSCQCMVCSDDRNPYEIFNEGHVNHMIKKLIKEHNVPLHVAYRLASFSAAKHFGLKRMGLIAPGYKADFVLLSDYKEVEIDDVMIKGHWVSQLDFKVSERLNKTQVPTGNSIKRKRVDESLFKSDLKAGTYKVIGIIPNQIVTDHLKVIHDGNHFSEEGINKIVVLERYGRNEPPCIGWVKGMNIGEGAIASSVSHDAHNLMAIGDNDSDIALAINSLIDCGGGFCVVKKGKVIAQLALPVAGLITFESAEKIAEKVTALKKAAKDLGITLNEPFLQMAFLALPVIPKLKITNKSLVDVEHFQMVDARDE